MLLDDRGFGFVRLARCRLAAAVVGDAAAQQVDRAGDMAILDQRRADRLDIAEYQPAASNRLVEVGPGLLELGHRIARGMFVVSHSRHRKRVASSISSLADTTNKTASAARRPARTSPTKSGLPGCPGD